MNLELPEKEKIPKKRIIMYAVILLICVIAVIVVVGVQILGNDVVDNMFGINKITKRTEEEEANLKANFENIFDNQIEDKGEYKRSEKVKQDENLVYTNYTKEDKNEKHEIDVNLPYININNEETDNFNKEIENTFKGKAEEILKDSNQNIIYIVKYKAYVENNILSLVIYSDLKQNTSAQRVIVQTFNFDLKENKKLTLEDIIDSFDLKKADVQNKINTDIQKEQKKSEDLIKLGYNIFSRDINSDIYKVENASEYFVYNNNIYIIFAYGNNKMTSEKHIVII